MDDAILKNRLNELVRYLYTTKTMPAARPPAFPAENAKTVNRCRRNSKELLDTLGFTVKYLIFDLEATRRENAVLRKILTDEIE